MIENIGEPLRSSFCSLDLSIWSSDFDFFPSSSTDLNKKKKKKTDYVD